MKVGDLVKVKDHYRHYGLVGRIREIGPPDEEDGGRPEYVTVQRLVPSNEDYDIDQLQLHEDNEIKQDAKWALFAVRGQLTELRRQLDDHEKGRDEPQRSTEDIWAFQGRRRYYESKIEALRLAIRSLENVETVITTADQICPKCGSSGSTYDKKCFKQDCRGDTVDKPYEFEV